MAKPKTERKRVFGAKLHNKRKFIHVHLSKELREKYKKRAMAVRKGDTVKILRGKHKGKTAKVSRVSLTRTKVFLEGITIRNARGRESPVPFEASNLMIISLNEKDRK